MLLIYAPALQEVASIFLLHIEGTCVSLNIDKEAKF